MADTEDEYKTCLGSNPACATCPSLCCTTATWGYPPPVLSDVELARIRDFVGHSDFYTQSGEHPALRMREDGACIFLDPNTTLCTIYPVRPYDCHAFPFDFISHPNGDWHWIMWDCGLAAMLDEQQIEEHLLHLEREFADALRKVRSYGNLNSAENAVYQRVIEGLGKPADASGADSTSEAGEPPFRILRKVRIE